MDHDRARCILHRLENFNQRSDIVTLFQVLVIKAKRLEIIVFGLARSRPEFCQGLVEASVIFGDGHFVVVYDHDKVRGVFTGVIKTFKSFAAAQGTIANHGNHVS